MARNIFWSYFSKNHETTKGGVLMKRTLSMAGLATAGIAFTPAVAEWEFLSASATPPTQAQCVSAGRRCFTPQSMANSYNYAVLHALGNHGQGVTIAVIDSYGSDTIRHDLHVFNQAFG